MARFALSAFPQRSVIFHSALRIVRGFSCGSFGFACLLEQLQDCEQDYCHKMLLTSRTITKLSLINSPRVTFRAALLYIASAPVSILAYMALIVLFRMDSRMPFPLLTAKQDLAGFGSGTL